MTKNLLQRIAGLIPLTFITTFFWVGRATEVRELWIGIAAAFFGLIILILTDAFSSSPYYWGIQLLDTAIITFIIGTLACWMSEQRRGYDSEETVIDKVTGLMFTFFLVLPILIYAHAYFFKLIYHICVGAFTCGTGFAHFVAFAVITPIYFTFYFLFYNWDVWPKTLLELHFPSWLSTMLDDLFIAIYVALAMYFLFFLPFKIPFDKVFTYFAYTFANMI